MKNDTGTLVIALQDITMPQYLAIEHMLSVWKSLSAVGASRWVAFYVDGDGDFHPKITITGDYPAKWEDSIKRYGKPKLAIFDTRNWKPIATARKIEKKPNFWQRLFKRKPEMVINWQRSGEAYFIDYDKIAWELRKLEEK